MRLLIAILFLIFAASFLIGLIGCQSAERNFRTAWGTYQVKKGCGAPETRTSPKTSDERERPAEAVEPVNEVRPLTGDRP